jgi:hypothetical protein
MKTEAECNEHEVAEVTSVVNDDENVSKYAARFADDCIDKVWSRRPALGRRTT